MKADKEILDLGFESVGKIRRHSGSGSKRSLPLFNLDWNTLVPKPKLDFSGVMTAADARDMQRALTDKWLMQVSKEQNKRLNKLKRAGYTIEDPILTTYVYEYSAFFIYKQKG